MLSNFKYEAWKKDRPDKHKRGSTAFTQIGMANKFIVHIFSLIIFCIISTETSTVINTLVYLSLDMRRSGLT